MNKHGRTSLAGEDYLSLAHGRGMHLGFGERNCGKYVHMPLRHSWLDIN